MIDKNLNKKLITVMVFAKAPIAGEVKTRLGKDLGMRQAAAIYRKLLFQCLKKLSDSKICHIELWCYPTTRHPFFLECARVFNLSLRKQQGSDLGLRMLNAFKVSLFRDEFALLMGSDIPAIEITDIERVNQYMNASSDVVIIPTRDGGYGLIAMKNPHPELFKNMQWSTTSVLDKTLLRMKRKKLTYELLSVKRDIDNKADYIAYRRRSKRFS